MKDCEEKYKELKAKYNATINKHIVDKLEWLKVLGKLNDRIRKLELERFHIKRNYGT